MTPDAWDEATRLMDTFYNGSPGASDEAYTRLTEMLLGYLTNYIRSRPGGRNDAEEIAWEVLVRVWVTKSSGARYNLDRPFRDWLHRIVRNDLYDRGRRAVVRGEAELPPDDIIPERNERADIEVSSPEWMETFARQHNECRKGLNKEHADVYERHCHRTSEGGSVTDVIATPLGLSYSKANSLLFKAREQMRECLRSHGFQIVNTGTPRPDGAGIVCLFRDRETGEFATMLIYNP